MRLDIYDLRTGASETIDGESVLAGWAGDDLFFFGPPPDGRFTLMRYRWGEPWPQRVITQTVNPFWNPLVSPWAPDRQSLAVTLVGRLGAPQPVLVTLGDSAAGVVPLAGEWRYGPALTPDGAAAAVVAQNIDTAGRARLGPAIELARPGQPAEALVTLEDLRFEPGIRPQFGLLHWSPDGGTLAFVASGDGYGSHLFLMDALTRALTHVTGSYRNYLLPLQFSADGRYLGYLENANAEDVLWLVTRETATGRETRTPIDFGHLRRIQAGRFQVLTTGVAAWAPGGHLLAVSGEAGLYVLDPATGDRRWVTLEPCGRVVWYQISLD
jgi:hypothetical protein